MRCPVCSNIDSFELRANLTISSRGSSQGLASTTQVLTSDSVAELARVHHQAVIDEKTSHSRTSHVRRLLRRALRRKGLLRATITPRRDAKLSRQDLECQITSQPAPLEAPHRPVAHPPILGSHSLIFAKQTLLTLSSSLKVILSYLVCAKHLVSMPVALVCT